ncbi:hypothetical protein SUGI_0115630 [Cryptomeria japonica]|nr:hypothetical protein SUGI_0115630 [Cryptomeria japonica]
MIMEKGDKQNLAIGAGRLTLEGHRSTASARKIQYNGEQMLSRICRNSGEPKSIAAILGFNGSSCNNLFGGLASHPRAYLFGGCKQQSLKKPVCLPEGNRTSEARSYNPPMTKEFRNKKRKTFWEPVLFPIPE